VNVIFAGHPEAVAAARNATSSIPTVVVDMESDPVAMRYIKSLAHPGGNLTGVFLDLRELRRSQTARLNWERFIQFVDRFFPPIRTVHPLPFHRFDAKTRGRSPVR
jgi:hypothetical protein